jgi:hypothetical protein
MIVQRILVNALVLVVELGGISAVAWFAWSKPLLFALCTGLLALAMGLKLEYARLQNEFSFYFGRALGARSIGAAAFATGEAVIKGLLAGIAALLTFSGTNGDRLTYVAALFAGVLFAGTSLLRWLTLRMGGRPERWGYFRLAAMLGLLFSAGLAVLAQIGYIAIPDLAKIVTIALWETASKPDVGQASELLFQLKQYLDEAIVGFLSIWVGPDAARVLGVALSVNVLSGFVAAIYAVVIADVVRRLDEWLP